MYTKYHKIIHTLLNNCTHDVITFISPYIIILCAFILLISSITKCTTIIDKGQINTYKTYKYVNKYIYLKYSNDNSIRKKLILENFDTKIIIENNNPTYVEIYKTNYNLNGLLINYNKNINRYTYVLK